MIKHNPAELQNDNNVQMSYEELNGDGTPVIFNKGSQDHDEVINKEFRKIVDHTGSSYDLSDTMIKRNMDQSITCQPPHFNSSGFIQYHKDIMASNQGDKA